MNIKTNIGVYLFAAIFLGAVVLISASYIMLNKERTKITALEQSLILKSEKKWARQSLISKQIDAYVELIIALEKRTGKSLDQLGLFPERYYPAVFRQRLTSETSTETVEDVRFDLVTAFNAVCTFDAYLGDASSLTQEDIGAARSRPGSTIAEKAVSDKVRQVRNQKLGSLSLELDAVDGWTWETVPGDKRSQRRRTVD